MAMGPTLQTTTSVSTGQIDQNSMQRAYQALGIPYNGKNQTRPPGMPQALSKFRSTLANINFGVFIFKKIKRKVLCNH